MKIHCSQGLTLGLVPSRTRQLQEPRLRLLVLTCAHPSTLFLLPSFLPDLDVQANCSGLIPSLTGSAPCTLCVRTRSNGCLTVLPFSLPQVLRETNLHDAQVSFPRGGVHGMRAA